MIKSNNKINWLQLVIIFLLGILLAVNAFLFIDYRSVKSEIAKLKADDLVLAQVLNNLLNQQNVNNSK